jgi:asparagine synthase (glutamine-hydrolysing)
MCRIAGIISERLTAKQRYEKVDLMCQSLKHGGPDDDGIFCDEKASLVFGHRRLSIIDLSNKGHQPMADILKKAWITFNGEIYNYLEIRELLSKEGASFYSGTDTEVILQAYLYWGVGAFSKLRGMFAFALYDTEKATTYLVRDTSGIKPLYYHIENDQLSFASEVKALRIAGIATVADETWPVKLLAFGNIPEPYTTLKNVLSLPKGNFLAWNHMNSSYAITSYNQAPVTNYITNAEHAEEAIADTLKRAVRRQLIADAPIGVFLSGGIDSSLITLLASQQKQQRLKTISIFFDEKAYDERQYQNLIIDRVAGEKCSHLVKQKDFDDHFPQIINAMDMPTTDGINSWFISCYARADGLKAVLSGIGGDELFGGYPSFRRIKYLSYFRKLPAALLNATKYFPTDRYKKISFLTNSHYLADYLLLRGLFVPTDIAKILNIDKRQVDDILFNTVPDINLGVYNEEQASWFESNLYMQNQLLRDADVMSMCHGLEVRVPFLDEDFQQLVQSISPEIRFSSNQPKKLLIDSFKETIPPAIVNRPKMGFSFPLQQWMKEHDQISDESLYKGSEAKKMVKKFKNDQVHWSKIFALYQIQLHA